MEWFKRLFGNPKQVGAERRRSYRVRVSIPCVLIMPTEAVTCKLADFSNHGMRIIADRRLKASAPVKLLLQGPPGREETLTLSVTVAWCRRAGDEFSVGLAYVDGELPLVMRDVSELVRSWQGVPADLNQKRKTHRLERTCPLQYRTPGGDLQDGLTQDISEQQIRFSTASTVSMGAVLEIFLLLGEHDPVLLVGAVTRCEPTKAGHNVTVRIDSVVDDERNRLEGLLEQPASEVPIP
ncbi:MAG TPA: PilZ domain-containing protein [Candidatus Xenobia bacterium]